VGMYMATESFISALFSYNTGINGKFNAMKQTYVVFMGINLVIMAVSGFAEETWGFVTAIYGLIVCLAILILIQRLMDPYRDRGADNLEQRVLGILMLLAFFSSIGAYIAGIISWSAGTYADIDSSMFLASASLAISTILFAAHTIGPRKI